MAIELFEHNRIAYVSPDGFKTGEWIRGQIRRYQRGTMEPKRQQLLEEIGLINKTSQKTIVPQGMTYKDSLNAAI